MASPRSAVIGETSERTLFHRGRCHQLFRDTQVTGRVGKRVADAAPRASAVAALRHEYELLRDVRLPGIVRVLELTDGPDGPTLMMEDAGPQNLAQRLHDEALALDIGEFLHIATQLAAILSSLHAHRIVHGNLSPSNIVWDPTLRRITLVDFSMSTTLTTRSVDCASPAHLEGTLSYISPEQTGRTGRSVDARADLYSAGAVLYELLTGRPPFPFQDPIELVHAHLARRPQPPEEVNGRVPALLSHMVLKLLEKEPEGRYQTATALETDLRAAQMQWQSSGRIEPFALALRDVASALRIGDKLYGRDNEMALLHSAYTAAAAGEPAFLLVTGPPGIGKSALVKQLQRHVMEQRGLFIFGKFDQLHRSVPYAGLVQAFRMLVRQLLTEPETTLAAWRERMGAAVAPNGGVLVEVIPELERVLGPQQPVVEMGPVEAQNRFNGVFSALLRVFADAEHPLALFLDDLQWVDAASLRLLERWVEDKDNAYFLLLGSYRDSEVDLVHPLAQSLKRLRDEHHARLPRIELGPLSVDDVAQLLADTFRAEVARTRPFAEHVVRTTAGNAFFVRRLLHTLHAEKLVHFVPETCTWDWDLQTLARVPVADNVLDLMVASIRDLPAATVELLQAAACIGHRFDLSTLAEVTGRPRLETTRDLWPALEDGLVLPLRETYKVPHWPGPLDASLRELPSMVMFVHDRVQQAAYSLLDEARRQRLHLDIGRRQLLSMPPNKLEEALFEVVDQLNLGEALMDHPEERLRLAQLNLAAGRKAKASAAYQAAFDYLTVGRQQVPSSGWQDLAFALTSELAACAYLTGRHQMAESIIEEAMQLAPSILAKMELTLLRVQAATVAGDYVKALARGGEGLALVGMAWPAQPAALDAAIDQEMAQARETLSKPGVEALAAAPEAQSQEVRVTMHLLSMLGPPAYFHDSKLLAYTCTRLTNLSLRHGPSPYTAYGYALFALLYNRLTEDYGVGHAIGRLALALARRFGNRVEESRTLQVFGVVLNAWKEPLRNNMPLLKEGYQAGLESGELQYAALNLTAIAITGLPLGMPLSAYQHEIDTCMAFSKKHHNKNTYDLSVPYRQALRCLTGRTERPNSFDDNEFTEAQFLLDAQDNLTALAFYGATRCQALYLAGDLRAARERAKWALPYMPLATGMIAEAEHVFYWALACAGLCSDAPAAQRAELVAEAEGLCLKLSQWARHCPANFAHKEDLVRAELARVQGHPWASMHLARQALQAAGREGFAQDRALAAERLAELYLAEGDGVAASAYLRLARDGYHAWGAVMKVRQLEQSRGSLLWQAQGPAVGREGLDTLGLIKASQAIAAETEPDRLFARILQIMVEVAGAEGGTLLLDSPTGLRLRGHISPSGDVATPAAGIALRACADLPHGIIRYVARTRESLVLADAAHESGLFSRDGEVQRLGLRSVLCVPLQRQAEVMGILYLTNSRLAGAFTPERGEVVRVLAAQAVISLERAEFLRERERSERAQRFLASASAALIASLDHRAVLTQVAHMAVPAFADWCILDLDELSGEAKLVVVAHADAAQAPVAEALRASTEVSDNLANPAPARHGAQLVEQVTPEILRTVAPSEAVYAALQALAPSSLISVPLRARGRSVGVLTFVLTQAERHYDGGDLELVEELAQRCALAVDNARLYNDAQQAVQVREDFMSIASHELKTPLTPLQLQLSALQRRLPGMVQDADTSAWLQGKLAILRDQGKRLERLVNELLDISRISAGHLEQDPEPVELMALVKDVVTRFEESGEIERSGSPVSIHLGAAVQGRWDRLRVEQVVTNLLSNALKYGRRKPVAVTARGHGDHATIEVADQGIGIAPEHRERIFGRFERAVSARQYGGLGLGLYIVNQIVRATGGSIQVKSRHQEGSTFIVTLPVVAPH